MAIKKIFKTTLPHIVYVTKKGKNLMFSNYKHVTDNRQDIAELEDEIKSGHPHLYIDAAEAEIDTTLQDEIAKAQKDAALKVMEEHAAKTSGAVAGQANTAIQTPEAPAGTQGISAASLLGVTSSASLGALSAPSNQK